MKLIPLIALGLGLVTVTACTTRIPVDTADTDTDTDDTDTDDTDTDDTDTDTDTDTNTAEVTPIKDIQDGTFPMGNEATIIGVVTATSKFGMMVQDGTGAHSGLWVFMGGAPVGENWGNTYARGVEVRLTGVAIEFNGTGNNWGGDPNNTLDTMTELEVGNDGFHEATGNNPGEPAPTVIPASLFDNKADLEPYEGVLVRIEGALTVDEADSGFGEWTASGALIDQAFYTKGAYAADSGNTIVDGAGFTSITGVLNFDYQNFKLAPREAGDLAGFSAPAP